MPLELQSLSKAVDALGRALAKSDDADFMRALDEDAQRVFKSGVIQHFEFTYELCWKFMKRWLETNIGPAIADGVTRRELFRLAAENQLVLDVDEWMHHHDARNETSHAYDPTIAEQVYVAAHEFVRDAASLLKALESRND